MVLSNNFIQEECPGAHSRATACETMERRSMNERARSHQTGKQQTLSLKRRPPSPLQPPPSPLYAPLLTRNFFRLRSSRLRRPLSLSPQESPKAAKGRRRRYLRLSPSRLSPKGASRANVNEATADGNGLSRRPRKGWVTSPLPSPKRESPPRPPRQHHLPHRVPQEAQEPKQSEKTPDTVVKPQAAVVGGGDGGQ